MFPPDFDPPDNKQPAIHWLRVASQPGKRALCGANHPVAVLYTTERDLITCNECRYALGLRPLMTSR